MRGRGAQEGDGEGRGGLGVGGKRSDLILVAPVVIVGLMFLHPLDALRFGSRNRNLTFFST